MKITVEYLREIVNNELLITVNSNQRFTGKVISYNSFPGDTATAKEITLANEWVPIFKINTDEIKNIEIL